LYLTDDPEAVAFIKGNVSRIRAFEVGSDALLVASSKSVFHQQRAEALADPVRIGGNEGQIPMWLVGMMFGHSLEHESHIIGDLRTQSLRHDCAHYGFIGLDAGLCLS
jgi:hypothetical protein